MDWLKNILQSLPLDKISDILGEIVIWWSQMVKNVPPADLPMYAYLGGAVVVLILWLLVARMLPRPIGGMSWMILFAILLAPGSALSDPSIIAPATIGVVYAIMMKDTSAAISNGLPILLVLVAGLFIGFVWQLIRGAFESSLDKARQRTAEDTVANMQLASGNYLAATPLVAEASKPLATELPVASNLTKNVAINTDPVSAKAVTASAPNPIQPDSHLKQDRNLEKQKIEGFYSQKVTKQPVIKVNDDIEKD
jgi:glucan phosphoethanolaminetransferase (alkaline phosphatase superfamily)